MKNPGRYVLQAYANRDNVKEHRTELQHTVRITYSHKQGVVIELSEKNSLVENEYSLNLTSAEYHVEGTDSKQASTDAKEAMIHHHQKGHRLHHLQFRIRAKETIRIYLDKLADEDYQKCIEGFLHATQDIIEHERQAKGIAEDLQGYFFNERIAELGAARTFLLRRIRMAHDAGQLTADEHAVDAARLEELRKEDAVRPFLEWDN